MGWRLHRRMQSLRALARCSCLNGAAQQRSEFCSAPRQLRDAGLPRSASEGVADLGSPSFAFFSWRVKKRRCAAGRMSRPLNANQSPQLKRARDERITTNSIAARADNPKASGSKGYKPTLNRPLNHTPAIPAPPTHCANRAPAPAAPHPHKKTRHQGGLSIHWRPAGRQPVALSAPCCS